MENNKKKISLEDIGNKLPFSIPENYFEQFASNIEGQIVLKQVPFIKLMRPWLYLAAMFIGVLFISRIGYTVYDNNKQANADNYELYVMSQVNDAEVLDYYFTENKN